MTTALVVDDEPHIVRAIRINLVAHGYEVVTAHDGPRNPCAWSLDQDSILMAWWPS